MTMVLCYPLFLIKKKQVTLIPLSGKFPCRWQGVYSRENFRYKFFLRLFPPPLAPFVPLKLQLLEFLEDFVAERYEVHAVASIDVHMVC